MNHVIFSFTHLGLSYNLSTKLNTTDTCGTIFLSFLVVWLKDCMHALRM